MSRVHDMGGQTGFGAVPVGDIGPDATPGFHADWEARVYALAKVLQQRGVFNGDELRDAIERLPPAVYLGASYYERWLGAVELLLSDGNAAAAELGFRDLSYQLRVVANTPEIHNVIVCTLCSCYPVSLLGPSPGWYKSFAYRSRTVREPRAVLAEFGVTLGQDVSI